MSRRPRTTGWWDALVGLTLLALALLAAASWIATR